MRELGKLLGFEPLPSQTVCTDAPGGRKTLIWTLSKDTQSLICNLTAKLSKRHGIGPECIRLLSRKAAMIITPSLPLKTHPKEHNKHEDLEEGAEDMRVTAQK